MFKSAQQVIEEFKAHDVKFQVREEAEVTILTVGVSGQDSNYELALIFRSDNSDFALRVPRLVKVPQSRRETLLSTVNRLNARYRFVKFVLDEKVGVVLEWDCPARADNPGQLAHELLIRTVSIIDDAYPILMKAIWGEA